MSICYSNANPLALYCDEYLLERLRILATDPATPSSVKKKVQGMFVGWSQELQGQRGYERLAALYKQLPQRARKSRPQPKYLSNDPRELEDDDGEQQESGGNHTGSSSPAVDSPSSQRPRSNTASGSRSRSNTLNDDPPASPSFSSRKKSKKPSRSSHTTPTPLPRVDLTKERPKIQQTLAEASSASINLMNALQLINWEQELSTENKRATECFNKCRRLRKNVLRYIHSIESEEFIGSLIHANEELIQALQKYDKMSQAPDDDSDSDYENDDWRVESGMRNVNLNRKNGSDDDDDDESESDSEQESSSAPSRYRQSKSSHGTTHKPKYEEEDDENPFGDSHVIETPVDEREYIRY